MKKISLDRHIANLQFLPSMKFRKAYCQKHFKYIGQGSSRAVYQINKSTVVKLATNIAGIIQNKHEANPNLQKECGSIIAKVKKHPTSFNFLISEKADKTDYDDDFSTFRNLAIDCPLFRKPNTEEKKFLKIVNILKNKYEISKRDLYYPDQWGKIKNKLVIVDYGFKDEMQKTLYDGRKIPKIK